MERRNAIFAPGGAGTIEMEVKNKTALRGGVKTAKKLAPGLLNAWGDADINGGNIQEELRMLLVKNSVRVIDLFRVWDEVRCREPSAAPARHPEPRAAPFAPPRAQGCPRTPPRAQRCRRTPPIAQGCPPSRRPEAVPQHQGIGLAFAAVTSASRASLSP